MDKNIIKQYLTKTFIQEASKGAKPETGFPAAQLGKKIAKTNKEDNAQGVKDIAKDVDSYEKSLLKPDVNQDDMAINKFNYSSKSDKTYHDEMEIMNGQEMLQYDDEPDSDYKKRATEAIEGSTRMGNNPEWANVVEKPWGGSSDFGKQLVKRIKDSVAKRNKETPSIRMQGRDIQADRKDYGNKPYALESEKKEKNILKDEANKNKPQIKETMKRLKFKNEFKGVGNALKLIPESYREDKKVFEMTDGNENYRIRWEGSKESGSAVILTASDKKMVNEDIQRMKALFNYKSEDTLGTLTGKERIAENKTFDDIWKKTKTMLEGEDIESVSPKEGDLDDAAKSQAPEAKKHIEGSVATEKKTESPAPKVGQFSDVSKPQAPEAKKHVEGSVKQEKKTEAPAPKVGVWNDIKKVGTKGIGVKEPAEIKEGEDIESVSPKEGLWNDIDVPQAPEAKKHIEGSTSDDDGTDVPAPAEGHWEDGQGGENTDKGTKVPKPKEGDWQDALKGKAKKAMAESEKKK